MRGNVSGPEARDDDAIDVLADCPQRGAVVAECDGDDRDADVVARCGGDSGATGEVIQQPGVAFDDVAERPAVGGLECGGAGGVGLRTRRAAWISSLRTTRHPWSRDPG